MLLGNPLLRDGSEHPRCASVSPCSSDQRQYHSEPRRREARTTFVIGSSRSTSQAGGIAMARMHQWQLAVALGLVLGVLAGCEQKGPAEKAGEKVDSAVDKAVKDATK